jgi:hypothetical protein
MGRTNRQRAMMPPAVPALNAFVALNFSSWPGQLSCRSTPLSARRGCSLSDTARCVTSAPAAVLGWCQPGGSSQWPESAHALPLQNAENAECSAARPGASEFRGQLMKSVGHRTMTLGEIGPSTTGSGADLAWWARLVHEPRSSPATGNERWHHPQQRPFG